MGQHISRRDSCPIANQEFDRDPAIALAEGLHGNRQPGNNPGLTSNDAPACLLIFGNGTQRSDIGIGTILFQRTANQIK